MNNLSFQYSILLNNFNIVSFQLLDFLIFLTKISNSLRQLFLGPQTFLLLTQPVPFLIATKTSSPIMRRWDKRSIHTLRLCKNMFTSFIFHTRICHFPLLIRLSWIRFILLQYLLVLLLYFWQIHMAVVIFYTIIVIILYM